MTAACLVAGPQRRAPRADAREGVEDLHGTIRKRDPVFTARFHTLAGNDPNTRFPADLIPPRPVSLARAGSGQDGPLQSERGYCRAVAQLRHEGRNFSVGHRRVVTARKLSAFREEMVQVPPPS